MKDTKVFVDSDIVISSLISTKGAAYFLLKNQNHKFIISNFSKEELEKVVKRLDIEQSKLQSLLQKRLKIIKLTQNLTSIKKDFNDYTNDANDTHIVAGAVKAKANVLLTYNLRDFRREKINKNLGIIVLTPAQYLQHLRSLE